MRRCKHLITCTLVVLFTPCFGQSTFTKITTEPVVAGNESGWACSWADYDDDGDIDLLVANGQEASGLERMGLFRNDGPAGFVRLTSEVGSLVDNPGRFAGGVWADYDNDGWVDVFDAQAYSDWGIPTNALFHASGSGFFTSVDTGIVVTDRFVAVEAAAWGDL